METEHASLVKLARSLDRLGYPSIGLRDALEQLDGLGDVVSAHIAALNAQSYAVHLISAASAEESLIGRQLRDLSNQFSTVGSSIQDIGVRSGLRFLTGQVHDQLAERLDLLQSTKRSIATDPAFPLANIVGSLLEPVSRFDEFQSLAHSAVEPSVALQRTIDEGAAVAARLATPFDDLQAFARSILGPGEAFEHIVDRLPSTAADGALPSDDADVAVTGEPEAFERDVAEAPTAVDMLLARAVVDAEDAHVAADLDRSGNVRLVSELVDVSCALLVDLQALARRQRLLASDGSFVMEHVTQWLIAKCPASARQIDGAVRALSAQIEALYSPRGLTRSGSESVSREQLEWSIDRAQEVRRLLQQKPLQG